MNDRTIYMDSPLQSEGIWLVKKGRKMEKIYINLVCHILQFIKLVYLSCWNSIYIFI